MSYGVNLTDLHRRSPDHVDRILKGERPGDLPAQQPTIFARGRNKRKTRGEIVAAPCLRTRNPSSNYAQGRFLRKCVEKK
jgi:hypothetical protein